MWYTNNSNNTNLVINLIFLWPNSIEINNYHILSDQWFPSNNTPLIINIHILEEFVCNKQQTIIKNNKKEKEFILDIIKEISNINMSSIPNKNTLEAIVQEYSKIAESNWYKYSQNINIIKWSKN